MSVYFSILKQWIIDPIQNSIVVSIFNHFQPILNRSTADLFKTLLLLPFIGCIVKLIKDGIKNYVQKQIKDHLDECVFVPVKRLICYLFKCDSFVQKLESQTEELKQKKVRLQQSVVQAEKKGEKIHENVTNWLSRAEAETQQAQAILESKEQAKMEKCFVGLCPSLKSRYQLSKRADEKALVIDKLWNEEGLDSISFRPPPRQRVEPSVYSREALPSRVLILNQVMDALKDPNLHMIGFYGMGGVGKTTLAKEVHSKALHDKLFDSVIMVAVSQTPELRRIQAEIADFLELKFDVNEVPARASRLHERLENSKVLIILDDIWSQLDLNSIGIPSEQGCKLLLTSRSKEVLSNEMGTQQEFSVDCLTEQEAWTLFHSTAANATDPQLQKIATEVAQKCAGLPLLILKVATDLKNKRSHAWKDMLKQLSDFNNEGTYGKVRSVLKTSYHSLPEMERSLFLLCSLYGRSNIWIRDLVRHSIGLGLFKDIFKIEDVRSRVLTLIDKLKANSLLLDGDMEGCVKMHDVVRDTALQIACEEENAFIGRSGVRLRDWPSKDCTKVSLPFCDIDNLPDGLECPKVELFFIFNENYGLQVCDSFFEGITKLKVVDFTDIHFVSLPSSLGFLTNLRTLCLENCQLDDVANIGQLKELECLSFLGSYIVELPREMEQLSQLKLLDLSNCNKLKVIPSKILSKLSNLEELYMGHNSFVRWNVEGNASLMELEELSQLTTLEMQVIDPKMIPSRLFSKGFQQYRIFIGDHWNWAEKNETSKELKLRLKTNIHLVPGLKELLKGAETLCMGEVRGMEIGLDGEGCQQLKHLKIQGDNVIQHVIESTKWAFCHAFPALETLFLDHLNSLEKICNGKLAMGSFSKLRILNIDGCDKLKNLFSFSLAKCLVELEELEVANCSNMEAVIAEGSEDANYDNEEIQFPQLSSLTLRHLPCLRSIYCPKKVYLETQMARSTTEDVLFNEMVSFPNLTSLDVSRCKSLKYICKVSTVKSLLQLKQLEIDDCEMVEEIILTEKFEERMDKIVFPNLDSFKLVNLPKFIRFSNGYSIQFQSLREMLLSRCPALKNFVSNVSNTDVVNIDTSEDIQFLFNEMVTFPNLQSLSILGMDKLDIWYCEALEYVFPASMACGLLQKLEKIQIWQCGLKHIVGKGKSEEEPYSFHFPHLTSLQLLGLYRLRSFYEGRHAFDCPKLEHLEIYDCTKANKLLKDSYRAKTEEHHIVPILSFDKVNPNLKTLKSDFN